MRTVWKYEIEVEDSPTIMAPGPLSIVHVEAVNGRLAVWVNVQPGAPEESVHMEVRGTGHPSPDPWTCLHRATVLDGPFVWHVYEQVSHDR